MVDLADSNPRDYPGTIPVGIVAVLTRSVVEVCDYGAVFTTR